VPDVDGKHCWRRWSAMSIIPNRACYIKYPIMQFFENSQGYQVTNRIKRVWPDNLGNSRFELHCGYTANILYYSSILMNRSIHFDKLILNCWCKHAIKLCPLVLRNKDIILFGFSRRTYQIYALSGWNITSLSAFSLIYNKAFGVHVIIIFCLFFYFILKIVYLVILGMEI